MKNHLFLFFAQVVLYTILVVNYRAVAHADYLAVALSDFAFASFNFFVIKKIASDESGWKGWLAYTIGGVIGSMLGIYISLQFTQ